ncbi:glutathione-disulfide reductase [Roseitranquillus sediminis]|uniref:glutathione-disulfide reductase n=1 Tax=Roseitranquillus sediminis TaxID=2809051 RepID=UPI001D0C69F7|nr:glutathione-disulfide reductase [Roseitranquillus sediminis]MBM9596456.1 glutathione-disulfide reductase [Roseitranquillus sediminis]
MAFDYDLFVVGGGSGGVRAARVAAQHGARVALAEEYRMGGTCVIRGCVPKKLMVFASQYRAGFRDAAGYGWRIESHGFDWSHFRGKLDVELARLESVYRRNLESAGVEIRDGRARISGTNEVTLNDGRSHTAKHILVATGGHPVLPAQVKGCELGITSNDVFQLEERPERILIVGGGYIACEFAGIFNGMGSQVTQWHRGPGILRGFDEEARHHLAEILTHSGIDLHLGTDAVSLERSENGIRAVATSGREGVFDAVIFATGRRPNTSDIGLEEVGVALGARGEIVVNEWSQSSVPSIHAVGDVTGRIALTPVAIREGHAFADTVFGGKARTADHECVPSAIFTQPEFGTVGLSEEEAVHDHKVEIYAATFRPMQNAFVGSDERVLYKLIVDATTRRVLGCHIISPNAGELIQLAGIAVKAGLTKEDFDRTVAVHPTAAEELVTMSRPTRTA